jgi:hypothetical protein
MRDLERAIDRPEVCLVRDFLIARLFGRFPGNGIGRLMKALGVENRNGRFFPKIPVIGQKNITQDERRH